MVWIKDTVMKKLAIRHKIEASDPNSSNTLGFIPQSPQASHKRGYTDLRAP